LKQSNFQGFEAEKCTNGQNQAYHEIARKAIAKNHSENHTKELKPPRYKRKTTQNHKTQQRPKEGLAQRTHFAV
jgi:hypothetical protein